MALQIFDSKLLTVAGALANHADCCCGEPCDVFNECVNGGTIDVEVQITGTLPVENDCDDFWNTTHIFPSPQTYDHSGGFCNIFQAFSSYWSFGGTTYNMSIFIQQNEAGTSGQITVRIFGGLTGNTDVKWELSVGAGETALADLCNGEDVELPLVLDANAPCDYDSTTVVIRLVPA